MVVAFIRGFVRRTANGLGSFWVDLTRATLHVLLPLSAVLAVVLVWQGVPQTFAPEARFALRDRAHTPQGEAVAEQRVTALQPGGNMEGKEARLGPVQSTPTRPSSSRSSRSGSSCS